MSLEVLFLGTGTSAGVPMIGCGCGVCRSEDPRDQRSRSSVLVRYGGRVVLIDTAPDLRTQMIRHRVDRLDGVFYTHAHADHIFGIDDLRRFNAVMKSPLDIYGEESVLGTIRRAFWYIFEPEKNINKSFVAELVQYPIQVNLPVELHGARWTPLRLMHGKLPILGYRVDVGRESMAYCTDVSEVPGETMPLLEGLDVLVLDGLRDRYHPTHLTINQALEMIERLRPGRAYLTHIAHDLSHADLEKRMPAGVAPAYDGLVVECGGGRSGR